MTAVKTTTVKPLCMCALAVKDGPKGTRLVQAAIIQTKVERENFCGISRPTPGGVFDMDVT